MMNITINTEKNGIELRFDTKPDRAILDRIKEFGFRWSGRQHMWYAKNTDERMEMVNGLDIESEKATHEKREQEVAKKSAINLWELTRTDGIENNFEKYHIYEVKEIAAITRKHLRERFPMCKWSVRSDRNSISLHIVSSPYEIESDVLKAIAHYAYVFVQSYNYDNSDSYSDYYDVNFYGAYEHNILSRYEYEQREATVSEHNLEVEFMANKAEFDAAEEIRKGQEFQERMKQMELDRIESERIRKERAANVELIEKSVVVKDIDEPYFITNCINPSDSKCDDIVQYLENIEEDSDRRVNCRIVREIHMSDEIFEIFKRQLLDDYSFFEGDFGGTATDDKRINDMVDYQYMSESERKTVEWYRNKDIAIVVDGVVCLIIDTEGYHYVRYVAIPDEYSVNKNEYHTAYNMEDTDAEHYTKLADSIEDASAEIIMHNGLLNEWEADEGNKKYIRLMLDWITANHFHLDKNVIRMIRTVELKRQMYKVLTAYNGVQESFKRVNLTEGQNFTLVMMSSWGMINVTRGKFVSIEYRSYAQYDDAVRLIFIPAGKRKTYEVWLHGDFVLYDGWLPVMPDSVMFDIEKTPTATIKKSKYLSCDRQYYRDIIDYYASININPIITRID